MGKPRTLAPDQSTKPRRQSRTLATPMAPTVALKPERQAPYQWRPFAVGIVEAAQSLGIGERTLKRLIADKRIPACKIETRTVIRTADLDTYVAGLPPAETKPLQ